MSEKSHTKRDNVIKSMPKNGVVVKPNVLEFKKRMLEWSNPVEYVNNMYGCHPGEGSTEYFKVVFDR